MFKVRRTKTGWTLFPKYLNGYSRNLPVFEKTVLAVSGEAYMKAVKKRILSQPKDVTPLSAYTVAKKLAEGKDTRMWIETGFWMKNLGITQVKKGIIFAGASKKKIHRPSGKSMADIAKIFEYGSVPDKIPPRPIFRPISKRFKKKWTALMTANGMLFFSSAGAKK